MFRKITRKSRIDKDHRVMGWRAVGTRSAYLFIDRKNNKKTGGSAF